MAKNHSHGAAAPVSEPEQLSAPVGELEGVPELTAADTVSKGAGSRVMVTLTNGNQIARSEYIKRRADAGASRGQIAKELTKLQGKVIPYQVVFAATKNHPNYKKAKGDVSTGVDDVEIPDLGAVA